MISILKLDENSKELTEKLAGCEVYLSSVTAFELLLRKSNKEIVEDLISKSVILPFDELAAKIASELHKKQAKEGKTVDMRDLFIAAIAISNDCSVLTLDKNDFGKIKELTLA